MPTVDPHLSMASATKRDDTSSIERLLHRAIRLAVWGLAVLMVGVIILGVLEVVLILYRRFEYGPTEAGQAVDISETFGAFMTVLIAIEIFENIMVYLRRSEIRVQIVMATALLAVARKVVILDYAHLDAPYFFGAAAVLLATAIGYWLVHPRPRRGRDSARLSGDERSGVERSGESSGEKPRRAA